MARRGMTGQLNMFDFFRSLDSGSQGEVEMVSLVPEFEEEGEVEIESDVLPEPEAETGAEVEIVPEPEDAPEPEAATVFEAETEKVAMSRQYEISGKKIEIAYINYNKVRITKEDGAPIIKEFTSTKEAVDYYVEKMQELEVDE